MNFENNYNLYNYTNLKNMSAINEILLNLIPSDLINDVMSYDAHTCCMKEIRERERTIYKYYEKKHIKGGSYRVKKSILRTGFSRFQKTSWKVIRSYRG